MAAISPLPLSQPWIISRRADLLWFQGSGAAGPSQLSRAGWLFRSFLMFAYLWAYWHLVRQHYGFLILYRRRAGLTSRAGARMETLLLWTGCLYPFLRFSLGPAYEQSGLPG